ncbi:MAG: sigma-70 family RNA polymerase sigma factor [Bradymonadia bacterium]
MPQDPQPTSQLDQLIRYEVNRVLRYPAPTPLARCDLYAYAQLGLLEARHRYQVSRGPFGPYAQRWIRGTLMQGLRSHSPISRRAAERLGRESEALSASDSALAWQNHLAQIGEAVTAQASGADPETALEQAQLMQRLRSALGQLPEEEREVIEAIYDLHQTGDSGAAWGRRKGLSRSAVSRRHHRALGRLAHAIEAPRRLRGCRPPCRSGVGDR